MAHLTSSAVPHQCNQHGLKYVRTILVYNYRFAKANTICNGKTVGRKRKTTTDSVGNNVPFRGTVQLPPVATLDTKDETGQDSSAT